MVKRILDILNFMVRIGHRFELTVLKERQLQFEEFMDYEKRREL
jgi:hypothetical protein